MEEIAKIEEAVAYLKPRIGETPEIAIILGSGLGTLAEEVENAVRIPYAHIPHFAVSSAPGHEGNLVIGTLGGKKVCVLQGRFHYYEGHDISRVVFPVRVLRLLGIRNLLVTNAAGGVNRHYNAGDLMLIKDHISFFSENPLRGPNIDALGPRFNDMTAAYPEDLRQMAKAAAARIGLALQEGIYVYAKGPSFETPAEIRMVGLLGADAVGMSTVPEVITAHHDGMRVLGISCISNKAAGISDQPLSQEEVMETGARVRDRFVGLLKEIVKNWR
ncbi:MAG: purine-nucleoside phosphorylase [Desulfobacteraceae bacterium]|nr:MAG: purine-nucleoside phosphorylase [Desulfobacteraceae bacterium]